ncbi:glycosyltransferase family 2 protein [Phaeospirillum tilakii]|uniref:Glycosyltransferase family 2 protein n=1 Tax=Phaeospirillum tilakii TaxID=741673 RepID=A0ABW5CB63_9PROT
MLSIISPLYNERDNVRPLYQAVVAALDGVGRPYELILVNDGSTDGTADELAALAATDPRLKVINFRRNHGQTAAMMAGIDAASGEILIPLDGDLQNDPADIPALLAKLEEGYDVVSGWRFNRQDAALRRNLPSRIANWLISRISGVHLHDYGCSLKAYRREVLEGVRLYGEMHRFVPIYASWQGARVTELPVRHHPRRFGQSKYGLERIGKVLLDLMLVKFMGDFTTKPIYVFGAAGLFSLALGVLSFLYACGLKLFEGVSFILTPLPLLSVFATLMGMMFVLLGFLAEMLVRVYYEAQGKPTYLIRDSINFDRPGQPGRSED